MSRLVVVRRWALREGHNESELLDLVRSSVIPRYDRLAGCLGLGLLRIHGTRSYFALQHWKSREARQSTMSSCAYSRWLDAYGPTLEWWNAMMEFEDEWETADALG